MPHRMERAVAKPMLSLDILKIAISFDDEEHRAQNPTTGNSSEFHESLTSLSRVVGNQENLQLRKWSLIRATALIVSKTEYKRLFC